MKKYWFDFEKFKRRGYRPVGKIYYDHQKMRNYPFEDLKDPRWKSLSLSLIIERKICEDCLKDGTVVHHKHYRFGHHLWEYSRKSLSVLCSACHDKKHQNRRG